VQTSQNLKVIIHDIIMVTEIQSIKRICPFTNFIIAVLVRTETNNIFVYFFHILLLFISFLQLTGLIQRKRNSTKLIEQRFLNAFVKTVTCKDNLSTNEFFLLTSKKQ